MLRAIIIIVLFVLYLILVFPLCLLGFLVGLGFPKLRYELAKYITKIASSLFFLASSSKISVEGRENIPKNQAVLFVGNHKSYIDIPLMIKYVPQPLAFIAKSSLKKVPLFNTVMTLLGCLFIDRQNVRQAIGIIKQGIEKLEHGESLLVFPEGSRSKTSELLPFKQGSLKLAEKSHVAIIPFAIVGTDDILGKNGFKITPSQVYLTFGQPINLDHLSPEDFKKSASYVQQIIQNMVNATSTH